MKKHTKIYMSYFGYDVGDFIPCEVCGTTAVDIHHINCRGMGGSNLKDDITNLMALCRKCHLELGDKKQHIELLRKIHANKISSN
jgi:hypothetical protein